MTAIQNGVEAKSVDPLQSVDDNDLLLGYSVSGNKYGTIRVGMINARQWAGCRWKLSDSTPIGEPCGSIDKIAQLSDLLGLGGYLVQNDHTRRKLNTDTHYKFTDGSIAALDGSMGHYQWGWGVPLYYAYWQDGTYEYEAIDVKPIPGHWNYKIPIGSRSAAGFATMDRTNGNLVSYINSAAQYRGGNNNSSKDSAWNSQLGMPATAMPITAFATAARKNGNLWFANERVMFFITGAIKRIIFHNKNIQSAINSSLTSQGVRQGGTGQGQDLPFDWGTWEYYPYVSLGTGADKGDLTGLLSTSINNNGTTITIGNIPSFYGLKNDYHNLWAMEEDVLLNTQPDRSVKVYINNNIDGSVFDNSKIDNHYLVGTIPGVATDYTWYWSARQNRERLVMYPNTIGGSETTDDCNGYYYGINCGLRGAVCLGSADHGGYVGSCCLLAHSGFGDYVANWGAALCEFKEAFSTEPFMA